MQQIVGWLRKSRIYARETKQQEEFRLSQVLCALGDLCVRSCSSLRPLLVKMIFHPFLVFIRFANPRRSIILNDWSTDFFE
jgi:hypothetical protein